MTRHPTELYSNCGHFDSLVNISLKGNPYINNVVHQSGINI